MTKAANPRFVGVCRPSRGWAWGGPPCPRAYALGYMLSPLRGWLNDPMVDQQDGERLISTPFAHRHRG